MILIFPLATLAGGLLLKRDYIWRETAAALKDSEERLRTTLDSISDAVVSVGLDGRISGMNPVAERLTGWSVEEAIGQEAGTILSLRREDLEMLLHFPCPMSSTAAMRHMLPVIWC